MNQYQLRKQGYKDDRHYITSTLQQRGIKYSTTMYSRSTRIQVSIDGKCLAYYDFDVHGELIHQYNHLPEIVQ